MIDNDERIQALSEEELALVQQSAEQAIHTFLDKREQSTALMVLRLMATIRDRDKTIAQYYELCTEVLNERDDLQWKNTVMLSALEQITDVKICCGCDDDFGAIQCITRDAIAKVKSLTVSKQVEGDEKPVEKT